MSAIHKSYGLDATAIARINTDLQKARTDPATSSSTYSALLSQLRTGVSVSEKLLRETRIGSAVQSLSKDDKNVKDAAVRKEAADLVNKWKKDISRMKTGSPKPTLTTTGGAGSAPVTKNGDAAVKREAAAVDGANDSMKGVEEKWKALKPSERNADKDGVDWHVAGSATRDNCLKLMYDGLVKESSLPPSTILPLAKEIETQVFDAHQPETSQNYKNKIRSLFSNLKASSHLRDGITVSPPTITPKRLVAMSPEELKSPEQAARDQKLMNENENNAKVGQESKAISNILQCGQCKQYKVSYSQAQTRSADEPMTTFCECTNCGKKWKFS